MNDFSQSLPYLAKFAIERTDENEIPGMYSYEQDLWVIEEDGKEIPIIFKFNLSQAVTKTKVRQESDDECTSALLELTTKTEVKLERDDNDISMNHLLELTTKTDTVQERDDESWEKENLTELTTKTFVAVERDEECLINAYSSHLKG
ncbi:hypothetical protein [Pantoea ananatis]|uniref:hypothetical protein n=1 Tax=Pantoea ananas TaxID=553 RepID=UPI00048B2099|nr:hypothetical protein [Pantoea ananatis]